jgi:NAD(P)-dependent dehydrogenase (short-subunit alcohol dehydrogenase family)
MSINAQNPHPVALVTGASSGIGRGTALQLAAQGARVIVTYHSNPSGAAETVAQIDAAGGDAVALALDVARSETFAAFVAEVDVRLRKRWDSRSFDYLVNNAGFGQMAMFDQTTEELFDELMRVILKGPYFLTQKLLPLLNDGGAIVNVTSNSSLRPEAGYSAYATMKGGLTTLTRYMAKELGARGIRVNSVAPGPTRTRIAHDAFDHHPEVIPPLIERTVLGRLGSGEDVGRVIAALLSDECSWVTGENLEASGGFGL